MVLVRSTTTIVLAYIHFYWKRFPFTIIIGYFINKTWYFFIIELGLYTDSGYLKQCLDTYLTESKNYSSKTFQNICKWYQSAQQECLFLISTLYLVTFEIVTQTFRSLYTNCYRIVLRGLSIHLAGHQFTV